MQRQTLRLLSTGAKRLQAASPEHSGSFKSFAEYRQFIVRKDPETLKARFKILFAADKKAKCPDSEAELKSFGEQTKKVAYNN
ncbi:hypothetical protein CANINC_000386 [Pichia inconspicua]|uniref:Uncharacterized protein n=1 Tax=Pichia inconspicua TaxID=52247 RepID=A0A4T0X6Q0_9ASCO|nr:hypothetical protein CANINC_000386 [[Candida] inconspicua]